MMLHRYQPLLPGTSVRRVLSPRQAATPAPKPNASATKKHAKQSPTPPPKPSPSSKKPVASWTTPPGRRSRPEIHRRRRSRRLEERSALTHQRQFRQRTRSRVPSRHLQRRRPAHHRQSPLCLHSRPARQERHLRIRLRKNPRPGHRQMSLASTNCVVTILTVTRRLPSQPGMRQTTFSTSRYSFLQK